MSSLRLLNTVVLAQGTLYPGSIIQPGLQASVASVGGTVALSLRTALVEAARVEAVTLAQVRARAVRAAQARVVVEAEHAPQARAQRAAMGVEVTQRSLADETAAWSLTMPNWKTSQMSPPTTFGGKTVYVGLPILIAIDQGNLAETGTSTGLEVTSAIVTSVISDSDFGVGDCIAFCNVNGQAMCTSTGALPYGAVADAAGDPSQLADQQWMFASNANTG